MEIEVALLISGTIGTQDEKEAHLATASNFLILWCPRRDSNPEPTDYESAALTVELQGHKNLRMVLKLLA